MISRTSKLTSILFKNNPVARTKVASPNTVVRWEVVESEEGDVILARSEDYVKTAGKKASLKDFVSSNFSHTRTATPKNIGLLFRNKISNIRDIEPENLKVIIAEVIPEASVDMFLAGLNHNPVRESLLDVFRYATKNTTNPYRFIENEIIPTGIGKKALLNSLESFIKEGSINSEDINLNVLASIIETSPDTNSDLFKEGFEMGLKHAKISNRMGSQMLRGYFAGVEHTYSFKDKKAYGNDISYEDFVDSFGQENVDAELGIMVDEMASESGSEYYDESKTLVDFLKSFDEQKKLELFDRLGANVSRNEFMDANDNPNDSAMGPQDNIHHPSPFV
jgi:hypothetical protein